MEDTLRRVVWNFLRYTLKHISPPESYSAMKNRQEEELAIFQNHCKHEQLSFKFPPVVLCINCQKVLRMATEDEQGTDSRSRLAKIEKEANEVLASRGEKISIQYPAPMTEEELEEEDRIAKEAQDRFDN